MSIDVRTIARDEAVIVDSVTETPIGRIISINTDSKYTSAKIRAWEILQDMYDADLDPRDVSLEEWDKFISRRPE